MPTKTSNADEFTATKAAYDALKELSPDEQTRAIRVLSEKLGVSSQLASSSSISTTATTLAAPTDGSQAAARRFMAAKQPQNAIEQVACLAFFLTYNREISSFKGSELERLNAEAGAPRIGNIRDALANAVRAHYLSQVGGGRKGLGILGEHVVNALPDRESVRAAIQQYTPRRRGVGKKRIVKK